LRQVLELGEGLFHLAAQAADSPIPAEENLRNQTNLILTAAGRALQAEAALWLATDVVCQLTGKPGDMPAPDDLTGSLSGLMQACLDQRRPCLADDPHSSRFWSTAEQDRPGLSCAVPLLLRGSGAGQPLGALQAQRPAGLPFGPDDVELLQGLAIQAALALQAGLRLADEQRRLERRAGQLSTVYQVSSAITSILDQDQLLGQVVDLIQQRFGYPYVHLYSVHTGRRKVFYEAGSGERSRLLHEGNFALDLDSGHGIIPWVARQGLTVLANDVSQEPRYQPSPLAPDTTCSELAVPLVFGETVLGVLDIQSEQLNAFGEDDRFLFEALADHIAIAMRNAQLYRSEVWRRRVADSLREVAGLLSAEVDLDRVLAAILAELGQSLPLDLAAIWLVDGEAGGDSEEDLSALHLAAVLGVGELDLEIGLTPDEVLRFNLPDAPAELSQGVSDWLREALQAAEPVVRAAGSACEPLGAALQFPPDYSAIAAPLRIREQPRGVLVLAHRMPGRYGSESRGMTAAFASYAAVAIENARLYEEAHEQAWVSTVLLQVANATQSLTNLHELLATVIHITPMLAGVRACLLYILDDEGDFLPAVAAGLSREQQAEFERWRFAPGDVPALDHLVAERQPVVLYGGDDDQRLLSILYPEPQAEQRRQSGLSVLVPLVARSQVLGVLLVDYSSPALTSGKSIDAFFDERLAILQGIAHQTAVAVDNIQLLKSQKEEAYVSVALLQVAQAVVSSSDLNEALGSIVRITPILVGVKRALILLWDEASNVFRLSQSYGLPRAAEQAQYGLGEFPLLDAVLIEDTLLAHPLWAEISASDQVPEDWTYLAAPEGEKINEYLENAPCLLLAFPLSVKGKVLGVFLVEEPEPAPGEGVSASNANRRLRGKRLEIITGISQQAALAIQNDYLQYEMVKQERLEREMQLAREIQSAFLPQRVPDLPGWDLKVRWRTAREVGGDFYDYFELPGNRLGLVIADVADKGMPAALFMTLVRTLVRATVREIDSPADVLERANDLIVPDAPSGMFVTIFYAVLDLDTGELEFANAGHNLPVALRGQSCQLELLRRGGMALGVEAGNPIQGWKTRLEAGDCLILYTDGVTEAFSPQGEAFGEARLYQTIESLTACQGQQGGFTAQDLLEKIDQAVIDFIANSQPSDDLTLLVLKRQE
jgi:serine phosphatase RsbU (regulator of sigma subunit)/transcriptional regulator with GAF, ATPase, and Fis domain